ncbi:MAG: response regulator [Alphaproteobacteria bacterium]|nr:response regulator [Rhodospirillales bacterium]MCW9046428.1 response regulator [Alphaproteobacteria bacterium]
MKVHVRTLLVEDSPSDADLIHEGLENSEFGTFQVTHVENLADAKKQLEVRESFDAVLLDLGLPDSQGLDTLSETLKYSEDIPVIVLTGLDDDEVGRQAVSLGADDFLVKGSRGNGHNGLITRSICFTLERHKLRIDSAAEKAKTQHEKQVEQLAGIGIANNEEPQSLSEREPDQLFVFIDQYREILRNLIDETPEFDMRGELEKLAQSMGELKAGPHDVVEIHGTTLKDMAKDCDSQRINLLVEEGHVTSLGLMGMLVSYYRKYA